MSFFFCNINGCLQKRITYQDFVCVCVNSWVLSTLGTFPYWLCERLIRHTRTLTRSNVCPKSKSGSFCFLGPRNFSAKGVPSLLLLGATSLVGPEAGRLNSKTAVNQKSPVRTRQGLTTLRPLRHPALPYPPTWSSLGPCS